MKEIKNILVTGAAGFMGKNLLTALKRRDDVTVTAFTNSDEKSVLESALLHADIVYHLAGVNRPQTDDQFASGNAGLTKEIVRFLELHQKAPRIILPSSIQAELDNPYGRSKKDAEDALLHYQRKTGASIAIYRLPNVFGKWSRPNYNTVVATFCSNIARDIEIVISDPNRELELVYIDDVVAEFLRHLEEKGTLDQQRHTVSRTFRVTLGGLAERIRQLHAIRASLIIPDLADDLMKCLHATYLSFLPEDAFAYPVKLNTDNRGWLFELIKSLNFGQIFVSKTLPGVTRGDHYHDTKLEKFCVIQGTAIIRFRHIHSNEILEFPVSGSAIKVVDIPPGYTHSIENIGQSEMICLFWANQIFSPERPDTYWEKVKFSATE
jgi:UDP-2-acetamido-2,6-beta-L-arabino-hexul-4-ose reductase